MKKSTNTGSALKTWLKNAFTKNLALKIVSLIFAMLLWGYVLMSENPQRTKTLTNVPISVEGGADLIARKLVLSGDKDYGSVTVRVSTQLTSYSDLTADDITASINLSNITATGEHEVIITARSAIGTTVSVSPDHIKVNVDNLVSRSIPVEIDLEGELDEGYWAGDVIYSRNMIDIEGPLEYVSRIDSAKGVLNIDSATSSINKSVLLTLYDNEGNELDADLFYSKLPSVTARMEVLPMKTVPIDVESAIQGKDNIPKNYELVGYGVNGTGKVRIVGEQDVLDVIDSIGIDFIDVSGVTESIVQDAALVIPEGVRLLDDDTVSLYINIREKTDEAMFNSVPINVEHLGRKLNAQLNVEAVDVYLHGRVSLLNQIDRSDIELYIDLSGLEAGVHQVPVEIRLPKEEMKNELTCVMSIDTVSVTIH